MRKFFLAGIASAMLLLSGCAGGPSTTNITDTISQVQQAARLACSFLPTTATVAGILATFVPGAAPIEQVAAQVAAQICAAVAPVKQGGRLGGAPPQVNGVVIHGKFVR